MEQNIDLKEIEKNTWLACCYQDGLFDLMIGVMLFGMGLPLFVTNWLGAPWRSMVFPGLALIIFFAGRHFITLPRMGKVKFGRERQAKRMKVGIFLGVVVAAQAALLFLILSGSMGPGLKELLGGLAIPLGIGIMAILIMAVTAHFLDWPRFYIYGVLMGIGIPLVEVLENIVGTPLDGIIAFSIPAVFVLAYGMITLTRFLRKYPVHAEVQ